MNLWVVGTTIVLVSVLLFVATREAPMERFDPIELTSQEETFLLDVARR